MKHLRALLFTALLALGLSALPALGYEYHNDVLFPGESVTLYGVTVTWTVSSDDIPTTVDASNPLGYLKIVGPKTTIKSLASPLMVKSDRRVFSSSGRRRIYIYIDDVFLSLEGNGKQVGVDVSISLRASKQPSKMEFSAAPANSKVVWLSTICPIQLNQWKISLSKDPVKYADGSKFHQVIGLNTSTGEEVLMPATEDAIRRFGRFQLAVGDFYQETKTAHMQVTIAADKTIRGRDAYVTSLTSGAELPYSKFLNYLAETFDFEVEWQESPVGRPDSVEWAKAGEMGIKLSKKSGILSSLLEEIFHKMLRPGRSSRSKEIRRAVKLEWIDQTHLRVTPAGYDEVLAEKEEEEQEEREDERFLEETKKQRALFVEQFDSECTMETTIFTLKHIAADAAKALVERELGAYYLLSFRRLRWEDGKKIPLLPNEKEGYFGIFSSSEIKKFPPPRRFSISSRVFVSKSGDIQENRRSSSETRFGWNDEPDNWPVQPIRSTEKERVIADSRRNILIVTATPKTQKKIEAILSMMDESAPKAERQGPIRRHRIEVTLLRGSKDAPTIATSSDPNATPLGFRSTGLISRISAKVGQKVIKGQALAYLDTSDLELEVKKLELLIDSLATSLVRETKRMENMEAQQRAKVIAMDEVRKAESDLGKAKMEFETTKLDLNSLQNKMHEKSILRAPFDGVVRSILRRVDQEVRAGETVISLAPPSVDGPKKTTRSSTKKTKMQALGFVKDLTENLAENLATVANERIRAVFGRFQPRRPMVRLGDVTFFLTDIVKENSAASNSQGGAPTRLYATYYALDGQETKGTRDAHLDRDKLLQEATDLAKKFEPKITDMKFSVVDYFGDEKSRTLSITYSEIRASANSDTYIASSIVNYKKAKPSLAEQYGISQRDLEFFGVTSLEVVGKSMLSLNVRADDQARATAALSDSYSFEMDFVQEAPPHLIVEGRLMGPETGDPKAPRRALLENTLVLDGGGAPSVQGLTNLRESLILIVRQAGPRQMIGGASATGRILDKPPVE